VAVPVLKVVLLLEDTALYILQLQDVAVGIFPNGFIPTCAATLDVTPTTKKIKIRRKIIALMLLLICYFFELFNNIVCYISLRRNIPIVQIDKSYISFYYVALNVVS